MFLLMALLLRAVDSGEQVFASENDGGKVTCKTAALNGAPKVSAPKSGCLLTSGSTDESYRSTPESEGGYWATLTSPSHGDLVMALPARFTVQIPTAMVSFGYAPHSHVRYLPHGPPGERTSRAPPIPRQLSRPLDA